MIFYTHDQTKKRFAIVETWRDITLQSAIDVAAIKLPEVHDTFEWFKHQLIIDQVMLKLTTLTQSDLDLLHPSQKVYLFTAQLLPFIKDLNSDKPVSYQPKLIKEFVHEGVEYLMPTSLVIDADTVVLQHGQKVKNFIEASNLLKRYAELKDEGIKVMPMFIASVVKEHPDEQWNEVNVIERSKRFATLPMDIVWEVFFCISAHTLKSYSDILQSMTEERSQTRLQRWVSRLGRLRLRQAELLTRLAQLRAWRYGTF